MELVRYEDMTQASYAGSSVRRLYVYGPIMETLNLSDKKPFYKQCLLIEILFLFAFIFIWVQDTEKKKFKRKAKKNEKKRGRNGRDRVKDSCEIVLISYSCFFQLHSNSLPASCFREQECFPIIMFHFLCWLYCQNVTYYWKRPRISVMKNIIMARKMTVNFQE